MKKTMLYVLTIIFMFSFAQLSYAAPAHQKTVEVEVTGDIDFEKAKISTFDDSKTISGTAEEGTVIDITISKKLSNDKLKEIESYTIEVGESGLFSQSVDLFVGDNYIQFYANKEDCKAFEGEITATRKNKAIKVTLESKVYLPGGICY